MVWSVRTGQFGIGESCAHSYVFPLLSGTIRELSESLQRPLTVLDIGCGDGWLANKLAELGHSVVGIDVSAKRIESARSAYPRVQFHVLSVYDREIVDIVGANVVDCIVSVEVLEHLMYPRKLFKQSYGALRSGGCLIFSTPYHGYLKNLMLSLINGWDNHFAVDWDGGHVKFFSKKTCKRMARQTGFRNIRMHGVGRLPWLWKSVILIAEK